MDKLKLGLTSAAYNVTSDAESTGSTRSSNSNSSNSSWRRKQGRSQSNSSKAFAKKQWKDDHDDKSLAVRLQAQLNAPEAQLILIVLIAFDICGTAIEIHLRDLQQLEQRETIDPSSGIVASLPVQILARLLESFTGFTLFLFVIELTISLAALRLHFFSQAGYVLDLAIVSTSLVVEMYAQTKVVRLFGVLRVWRVLRFVRKLVDQERKAHDTTRQLLEQTELKLLDEEMQKSAAHKSLKLEYESRAGLENLLHSYKDEIVTLKEALQIAAQAVAEATLAESHSAGHEYSEVEKLDSHAEIGYYEESFHPEKTACEPSVRYWQEGEDSESFDREAAGGHLPEIQQLIKRRWQDDQRHHEAMAFDPMETQIEAQAAMSETEFQDAVDEYT